MQLTTRDVTKFFNVSETTVQRWVKDRGFPAHRVNGQFRYSRAEVLEWASAHQIRVSPELFDNLDEDEAAPVSLAGAMEAGGVYYGVADSTKDTALRAMVELMPVPANLDRQTLLNLFLAREALGSTAVGDGIAIPHVRSPLVLGVERPCITLCFLERPVEFGALDARPVGILFSMICPTVRFHLQLLSRLAFALHNRDFRGALLRQAPQEEILDQARRIDASLITQTAKESEEDKGIAD
jgi:PTS system nitrogen regulatory IIA component